MLEFWSQNSQNWTVCDGTNSQFVETFTIFWLLKFLKTLYGLACFSPHVCKSGSSFLRHINLFSCVARLSLAYTFRERISYVHIELFIMILWLYCFILTLLHHHIMPNSFSWDYFFSSTQVIFKHFCVTVQCCSNEYRLQKMYWQISCTKPKWKWQES